MSLEFIMDPPDKPKSKSSLSIAHRFATACSFNINNILIEFYFPAISTTTKAFSEAMKVSFALSDVDDQGLVGSINFHSNHVEILKSDHTPRTVFQYLGNDAVIDVDVNIPTMMLNVNMKLTGQDVTTVQAQLFLEFFTHFQTAEDNSIEMKMAYGYQTGGKMKKLHVDINEMIINVLDSRSPVMMYMKMNQVQVELSTKRVTEPSPPEAGNDIYEDNLTWVDKFEDCNYEKTIHVQFETMTFLGELSPHSSHGSHTHLPNCQIESMNVKITKHIQNQRNFLDHEDIELSMNQIYFHYIHDLSLDWLLILQNIADNVPSSRFGHTKSSHIHGRIKSINSSVSPTDLILNHSIRQRFEEFLACYLAKADSAFDWKLFSTQLSTFTSVEIPRQFVRFIFREFEVTKTEEAYAVDSLVVVNFQSLHIVTNLKYSHLQLNYHLFLEEKDRFANLSVEYEVNNCSASFSLGEEFQLHEVKIHQVVINEYTYQYNTLSVQDFLQDPLTLPYSPINSNSFEPLIFPVERLREENLSCRKLKLFEVQTLAIEAAPQSLVVKTEKLIGAIGFISVIKCIATVDMITSAQKRITAKMDKFKGVEGVPLPPPTLPPIQPLAVINAIEVDSIEKSSFRFPSREKITILQFEHIDLDLSLLFQGNSDQEVFHLWFKIDGLINTDVGQHFSEYKWKEMLIYSNNEKSLPFLSFYQFLYQKSFFSTPCPESDCNKSEIIELTKLFVEEVEVNFHHGMKLSPTLDAFLNQKDGYSRMTSKKKKEELSVDHSFLKIHLARYSLVVHALYQKRMRSPFAVILWRDFHLEFENHLKEHEIQAKIQSMDTNSFGPRVYTGITGGKTKILWDQFVLNFEYMSPKKRYFYGEKISLEGYLYLATIEDGRMIFQSPCLEISDYPSQNKSNFPPVVVKGFIHNSPAPSKVYTNCTVTYNQLELFMGVQVDSLMSIFLDAIDECLPPNKDTVSPPLPWWDSIRYWTHGSCDLLINKLKVSTCRSNIKIDLTLDKIYMSVNRSLVELKGGDLAVNVSDQNQMRKRTLKEPLNKERNDQEDKTKWRICYIPFLSFSLAHTTSPFCSLAHDHHDIYIQPAHSYYRDRFYHFRMMKNCSIWGIHLTCTEIQQDSMLLALKLDVIQKIMLAFSSISDSRKVEEPPKVANKTPIQPDRRGSFVQLPLVENILECISSLDIHVSMDNFLACSWPSSTSLTGIVFSQDFMRLDIRLSDPSVQNLRNTVGSPSSGLQLEYIQGNVENIDVYIREWKRQNHLSLNLGDHFQCLNTSDVVNLFDPIYKLAHASKVMLKFEDEETDSPVIPTFTGSPKKEAQSYYQRSASLFPLNSARGRIVFKPSILSFRANHAAFTPPESSLPKLTTSQTKRNSYHALDLISRTFSSQPQPVRKNSVFPNTEVNSSVLLPQVNKMWDLKIIDIRLLWTITLRDMLAGYAARCSEILKSQPEQKIEEEKDELQAELTPHIVRSKSMDDSILTTHENSKISVTDERSKISRATRTNNIANILEDDEHDIDPDQVLDVDLVSTRTRGMPKRQSGEVDLFTHYLSNPVQDSSLSHLQSPNQHSDSLHPLPNMSLSVYNKRKRRGDRRLSLKAVNLNVEHVDSPSEEIDSLTPTNVSQKSFKPFNPPSATPSPQNQRLLSRSSSVDNSLLTPSKLPAPKKLEDEYHRNKLKNHYQSFFSIELQDPQVNILDEKTQSTLLIVIAGSSTLIGKKHSGATVALQGLGDQEKSTPKKKVNVRLKMENVNAYTISTGNETGTNNIYWKALNHTVTGQRTYSHRRHLHKSTKSEKFVQAAEQSDNSSDPSQLHGQLSKRDELQKIVLRSAINNFQMLAVYTYYEDVSPEEAAAMYIHRTREELMNSFMLDLPEVCLKVDSLQFSILLNTIRNVLLAPPPAQNEGTIVPINDEDSSEKKGIIRMISSDGVVPSLDNRIGRAQIKSIVEHNLMSLPDNEFCTAQSIEYFVGRGIWQMCSENQEDVLLEVGFMGLLGSHSFHEDRSSSSIFEVQRFWVRDSLDNQLDSTTKKTKKKQKTADKTEDRIGWVLMPVLQKEDACVRCKQTFDVTKNSANSCSGHVDSEGAEGQFKEMVILHEGRLVSQKCWSCCRNTDPNHRGCLVRPHICKESMISIRAESGIPAAIYDIDLTIFQTLEISVFPGCDYTIHVQITSQVLEMLHQYFSISEQNMIDEDDVGEGIGPGLLTNGVDPPNFPNNRLNSKEDELTPLWTIEENSRNLSGEKLPADSFSPMPSSRTQRNYQSQLSFLSSEGETSPAKSDIMNSASNVGNLLATPENVAPSPISSPLSVTSPAPQANQKIDQAVKQEALFIKYLRVGHINVEVNTVGFAFNLDQYHAIVNEFSLRNKVLDWHRLIWKYEKHIAVCMTSHTASNSMNKLWTIIFGKGNAENEKKERERYHQDDDTLKKKALFLGEY